jgi:hypothetical protein
MELYTLDSLYRRERVIDKFESLIWTERRSSWGDFQLVLHSTLENRTIFPVGLRLAMNESLRVMVVETVEDKVDDEGRELLVIEGRSIEAILEDRAARDTLADTTVEPKWVLTGLPAAIARKIFQDICLLGQLSSRDVIPLVIESGELFPEDNVPEPDDSIVYEIGPMTVYKAIKDLCDIYGLGFRMVRNFDNSQLQWDIYSGCDRTSAQTIFPAVVFSPNLDNLKNTSELISIAAFKNVAYVISPVGTVVVYADNVDPDVTEGFERRVLVVDANDITATDPPEDPEVLEARLIQRGKQELAAHRQFLAFDGEVTAGSQYKYGVNYHLGDLVEMQTKDGGINKMQVDEQIFVSDKEGERSYPTLILHQFITAGSWLAWPPQQVWFDLDASLETWADQP